MTKKFVLKLTYKGLNGIAPQYICDLLCYKSTSIRTRSTDQKLLKIPFTKYATFADRSFSVTRT